MVGHSHLAALTALNFNDNLLVDLLRDGIRGRIILTRARVESSTSPRQVRGS
jgi:hypothetical protein